MQNNLRRLQYPWLVTGLLMLVVAVIWGVGMTAGWLDAGGHRVPRWFAVSGVALLLLFRGIPSRGIPSAGSEDAELPRSSRLPFIGLTVTLWLLVGLVFWHFHGTYVRPFLSGHHFRSLSVYHYYINAKYFNELGYVNLYEQTVVADRESNYRIQKISVITDLRTYDKHEEGLSQFERSPAFSPDRWNEFKRDIDFFIDTGSPRLMDKALNDRGYNASPSWNTLGAALANRLDITSPAQRFVLLSLDSIMGLVAIGVCIWAFGFAPTGMGLLIIILAPINHTRLIGNFLNYDWMYMIVMGLAFYRKKRIALSGFCWVYAFMTRLFPLLMVLGGVAGAVFYFVQKRRIDSQMRRLLVHFTIWCGVAFMLGCLNDGGLRSWQSFSANILTHAEHHVFGQRRVGLKHYFTTPTTASQNIRRWRTEDKREAFEQRKWAYRAAALVMLLMLIGIYRKKRGADAMIWGLPTIFALLVSSRYYWSVLGVLPLLNQDQEHGKPSFSGSLVGLVVVGSWYFYADRLPGNYARYVTLNTVIMLCFYIWMAYELAGPRIGKFASKVLGQKGESRAVE
jgi:hypothetical protein